MTTEKTLTRTAAEFAHAALAPLRAQCAELAEAGDRVAFRAMTDSEEDRKDELARSAKDIADAALDKVYDAARQLAETGVRPTMEAAKKIGKAGADRVSRPLWWIALGKRMLMRFDPRRLRHPDERN